MREFLSVGEYIVKIHTNENEDLIIKGLPRCSTAKLAFTVSPISQAKAKPSD